MNRLFIFIAFTISILNINAQIQQAQLEIGSKTIQFSIEEKLSVWRTVSDTFIKCKGAGFKPYCLVPHTEHREISKSDFKIMHREVFNEHDCIWTRLTNDVIRKEDDGGGVRYQLTLLNDSVNIFFRPRSCWRVDSVIQINAITLEEEMVIAMDSESRVKFDLGNVSKAELIRSIQNKLGLGKSPLNLHLQNLVLSIYNDKCDWLEIDYRDTKSIEQAIQKIQGITIGSKIVLNRVDLENTNGRNFVSYLYEVAFMTLVE